MYKPKKVGVQDVQTEKGESKAWEPSETFADSAG